MEKTYKIRKVNGQKEMMTYEELCDKLGFNADVNFVRVTTAGTISFWAGKPQEIRDLISACKTHGFVVAKACMNALS